ncbi:hypothetical protein DFH28DRAFT_928257 [Melampsora americana]|nr:hypothetical protein DFH28DRAFT_928257 [Melampsora americana]
MPSTEGRVTRGAARANIEQQQSATTLPAAKRPRQQPAASTNPSLTASESNPATQNQQPVSHLNNANDCQTWESIDKELELAKINLQNYHQQKKHWPLSHIQAQLARQACSNHQLSAAIISEGQALLEALDHTIHMLAMVSGVDITKLKHSLGMVGGTHGENPWHRWLSFALDANKIPMPVRGATDAGAQLARRNKVNSTTYRALEDDQYMVFTARIFYALGGYPDYSAITIDEDPNVFGDCSTLVPEVPKLNPKEEAQYRPIYEKLVDMKKVARDRELNTPAGSDRKEEKRSFQCMKKIAQQLARSHQLMGIDYYIIACSNSTAGGGWCQEYTTRDEITNWVEKRAELQRVFPLYCQNGSTFDEIKAVAAASKPQNLSNNQSDIDKKTLCGKLSDMVANVVFLEAVLGYKPAVGRGFPRTPNPLETIKARNLRIVVERAADSTLTEEEFQKGFLALDAKGRRHWISNIDTGKFKIIKATADEPQGGGGETSSQARDGDATSNDAQGGDSGAALSNSI